MTTVGLIDREPGGEVIKYTPGRKAAVGQVRGNDERRRRLRVAADRELLDGDVFVR
jgi:hypothetical protein